MGTGRRLVVLLLALTLIGVPAAVLRVGCVGASCRSTAAATSAPAPFCSLPTDLRKVITAGTYADRSPDVMAVTASTPVVSDVGGGMEVPWPSTDPDAAAAGMAPLSFLGRGITNGRLPRDVTLDRVAPTLEPLLGLNRAHPEVRSGRAIPGVVRGGARTPLVVLVVWKGIGEADGRGSMRQLILPGKVGSPTNDGGGTKSTNPFAQAPYLSGVGTSSGTAAAGSVPLDPTAVEATIGTGGLPSQHGITGTQIRSATGKVVTAFGPGSPQPVIAALGDDLDAATGGVARIGLVATATGDRGLTGDDWYGGPGSIVDRTMRSGRGQGVELTSFLNRGWGDDAVPDLLAIGLAGSFEQDATATQEIAAQVLRAVPGATIVMAGTGSLTVKRSVNAPRPTGTDRVAPGGLFLAHDAGSVPTQDVVDALHAATTLRGGSPLFADAFASYAVRFGRYC